MVFSAFFANILISDIRWHPRFNMCHVLWITIFRPMTVIYNSILLTLRLISILTRLHKFGCVIIRDRYTSLKPINTIKFNAIQPFGGFQVGHAYRGHFGCAHGSKMSHQKKQVFWLRNHLDTLQIFFQLLTM